MLAMRELTKQDQVSFWSSPDVRAAIGQLLGEAQNVLGLRFRGQKVKQQHVINAVLYWLATRPDDERQRALREGLEFLESALAHEAPVIPTVRPEPPPAHARWTAQVDRKSLERRSEGKPRRKDKRANGTS